MIRIMTYHQASKDEIFARSLDAADVSGAVSQIIAQVRQRGDQALLDYAAAFDGGAPEQLEVTAQELDAAASQVDPAFLEILEQAAANIRAYHAHQVRSSFVISQNEGIVLGQKIIPMDRVGLYVPGGTAAYPSTVLMDAIPAKIAGCGELIMTTPAKNGVMNPVILAAAKVAGVDRIFKTGGAQAIAALAYGTESIPRVDKIVGPGNAYVAEAKRQVYGQVAIDMIAGPSEILIIADETCQPRHVAADLLSQAEHDKLASPVLITTSPELARNVQQELERQLALLPREEIARAAVENNGKIILVDSIVQAIELSNELAPEHLELCLDQPFDYLGLVKHAGSVFLGKHCPEALGDYLAGANHTLPTSGTARFSNPLSVDDFVKKTQFTYYTAEALKQVSPSIAGFARQEGLEGHARSVESRFEEAEA